MRPILLKSLDTRPAFMAAALLTCMAPSATAQAPIRGPHSSILYSPADPASFSAAPPARLRLAAVGNHAAAGAVIGGLIGAVVLTVVGVAHCESDCTVRKGVLGFLFGAALGAIPGALIGGAIPATSRIGPQSRY